MYFVLRGIIMKLDRELLKGTTETVVLAEIARQPLHGYQLVERLRTQSKGILALGEGTLYPLLYRLEANGLVRGQWEPGAGGRRKRVYSLTRKGHRCLADRSAQWAELVHGVALVLGSKRYA